MGLTQGDQEAPLASQDYEKQGKGKGEEKTITVLKIIFS